MLPCPPLRPAVLGDAACVLFGLAADCPAEADEVFDGLVFAVELLTARRAATAANVLRGDGLLTMLARVVAGSVARCVASEPLTVPGSVGSVTSGWLPLSVGETNPSNPGRAMRVVSVNAIAAPRMTETVMTARPSHNRTVARRPVSSVKTGLVTDIARQSPVTAPALTRGPGHAN